MRRFHIIIPPGPNVDGIAVYAPVIPRGPLQIARAARAKGWEVTVTDGYSWPAAAKSDVTQKSRSADLIGVSIHGAPNIEPAIRMIELVRSTVPEVPIVVGGNLATVAPEVLSGLLPPGVIMISGGATTTLDLLGSLEAQEPIRAGVIAPSGVDATWHLPDLDQGNVPFRMYASQPDFQYQLETQVGCPYRCFHCGTGRAGLIARTIQRPLDTLRAELAYLYETCRDSGLAMPPLWITDETFTADHAHVRKVCEVFAEYEGLVWRAQTRADCVDLATLELMRAAGCTSLAFGVEVPSDDGLTLFGKREEMERVDDAFRLARTAGLRTEGILVFGAPGDDSTFKDVFDTLNRIGADSLQTYIYHPVPGSPWWRKYGSSLPVSELRTWSALDFHSPLVTASSPTEADETIVRFLSSLVWTRTSAVTSVAEEWRGILRGGYECPRCGQRIKPRTVQQHAAVEVAAIDNAEGRFLIAAGPQDVVAYLWRGAQENIHAHVRYLIDGPIDEGLVDLCSNCYSLAGAQVLCEAI